MSLTENAYLCGMDEAIVFVSLGPGDPQLITLKALSRLRESDVIFCPATCSVGGVVRSASADILMALKADLGYKTRLFELPMSHFREKVLGVYNTVCQEIVTLRNEGKRISVACEGDAGFYSSIGYIYFTLKTQGVSVKLIPGVTSFLAASALAGIHMTSGKDRLLINPGVTTADELAKKICEVATIVIMKLSQCAAEICHFIDLNPSLEYHYFENIGTSQEVYLHTPDSIKASRFPYFSLLIIKALS